MIILFLESVYVFYFDKSLKMWYLYIEIGIYCREEIKFLLILLMKLCNDGVVIVGFVVRGIL